MVGSATLFTSSAVCRSHVPESELEGWDLIFITSSQTAGWIDRCNPEKKAFFFFLQFTECVHEELYQHSG